LEAGICETPRKERWNSPTGRISSKKKRKKKIREGIFDFVK
jgi:hypothetical protein